MFEAIKKNNLTTVSKLLSEGKSVDMQDKDHNTLVHLCLKHNCTLEMLNVLLSSQPIFDLKNNKGDCFLHTAIRNQTPLSHIQRLVEYNSKLIQEINFEELTPLSLACTIKTIDPKIISFLLQNSNYLKRCRKKKEEEEKEEEKEVKEEVEEKIEEEIEQELEEEKETKEEKKIRKKKKEFKYYKDFQRTQNIRKTARYSNVKSQEKWFKKLTKEKNLYPLNHTFLSKYQSKMLTPAAFETLASHNYYVFGDDTQTSINPFHLAIKNKLPLEVISIFLESGIDPNFCNKLTKFKNSLHIACKYCPENLLLIDLLLKYGADLELDDSALRTPLFYSLFCKKPKSFTQKEKEKEKEKQKQSKEEEEEEEEEEKKTDSNYLNI